MQRRDRPTEELVQSSGAGDEEGGEALLQRRSEKQLPALQLPPPRLKMLEPRRREGADEVVEVPSSIEVLRAALAASRKLVSKEQLLVREKLPLPLAVAQKLAVQGRRAQLAVQGVLAVGAAGAAASSLPVSQHAASVRLVAQGPGDLGMVAEMRMGAFAASAASVLSVLASISPWEQLQGVVSRRVRDAANAAALLVEVSIAEDSVSWLSLVVGSSEATGTCRGSSRAAGHASAAAAVQAGGSAGASSLSRCVGAVRQRRLNAFSSAGRARDLASCSVSQLSVEVWYLASAAAMAYRTPSTVIMVRMSFGLQRGAACGRVPVFWAGAAFAAFLVGFFVALLSLGFCL